MSEFLIIVATLVIVWLVSKIRKLRDDRDKLDEEKGMMSSIIRMSNIRGVPPKDLGNFEED